MKKLAILAAILLAVLLYHYGGREWLLPDTYRNLYATSPWLTAGAFFVSYTLMAALSIPGAGVMSLVAGAVFGLGVGILLVSFASSLGATMACLISRALLREWVTRRFARYLRRIDAGIGRDGPYYLLGMRLVPIFPFFIINLVMGLTAMPLWVFYLVSQVGMFPATVVFVNAGVQLGEITELSVEGILTPGVITSLVLLGMLPLVARWFINALRARRAYRPWRSQRPRGFTTNLLVIGAGSAGLVSAYIAAATQARVTLVERHRMGGDCLNTGCVPSKALIRSARMMHYATRAADFGVLHNGPPKLDFSAVMRRVHDVIAHVEPHDSIDRYTRLGVDCVTGEAELISPWALRVNGCTITAPAMILATGAAPLVPPIPGLDQLAVLTSDNLWQLEALPARLLVLGGGAIGCEMAQAFRRLGAEVVIADVAESLLPREDTDVSQAITTCFAAEGIRVLTGHRAVSFTPHPNGSDTGVLAHAGGQVSVEFDRVLVAVGRRARMDTPGLERLGLVRNVDGTLEVDAYLRTRYPNVYACGDAVGPYQFTHVAAHQAWHATVNALFGGLRKFKVDYSVIPRVTFTDPEVAHVGLSECEARAAGISYECTRYGIDDLDRAIADSEAHGFVKVLTVPGRGRILGATVVGYQAGNLIAELVLAMKQGIGLHKILATIHAYPTMVEANKYVASQWRRGQVSRYTLAWLDRFHRWQRGS